MDSCLKSKEQQAFHLEQALMCNGLVKYLRGRSDVFAVNDFSVGNDPSYPDDCYIGVFMARDHSVLDNILRNVIENMPLESVDGKLAKTMNSIDGYQVICVIKKNTEDSSVLRIHVKFCHPANLEFTTCRKHSVDITVFCKQ